MAFFIFIFIYYDRIDFITQYSIKVSIKYPVYFLCGWTLSAGEAKPHRQLKRALKRYRFLVAKAVLRDGSSCWVSTVSLFPLAHAKMGFAIEGD